MLENALGCILHSLATSADHCEALIISAWDSLTVARWWSRQSPDRRPNYLNNLFVHEAFLVLTIQVNVFGVVFVVFPDALTNSVETSSVDRIHLLWGNLLFLDCLQHDCFKV